MFCLEVENGGEVEFVWKSSLCESGVCVKVEFVWKRSLCGSGVCVEVNFVRKRSLCGGGVWSGSGVCV